jgi:predicted PurR-regulated permease PerM
LLGLGVALANLLPVIGIVVALLFTLAIGLLSSILFYPWLLAFVLVVLTCLAFLSGPSSTRTDGMPPFWRLLFLLIIGETMGLRWLILASPLAIAVQIIWNSLAANLRKASQPVQGIESLKKHKQQLSEAINELEEAPPALVSNLTRLSSLLEEAQQYLDQTI